MLQISIKWALPSSKIKILRRLSSLMQRMLQPLKIPGLAKNAAIAEIPENSVLNVVRQDRKKAGYALNAAK